MSESKNTANIISKELWDVSQKELNTMEGWNFELDNNGIQIHSKMLFSEINFPAYKMTTTIPFHVSVAFAAYLDHESRPKYVDTVVIAPD